MAHQTDEYCRVDRIEQAVEVYTEIIERWCAP
jgi:succinyl-diaminopimelate desuccinylase